LPTIPRRRRPACAPKASPKACCAARARSISSATRPASQPRPCSSRWTASRLTPRWARGAGVRYALTGSVDEWRYKVGVDGEPAAGVTLQLVDVASGDVLWAAAGGATGWSREALSAVAQKLMRRLLAPIMPAQRQAGAS
jgi:hypothetical protein